MGRGSNGNAGSGRPANSRGGGEGKGYEPYVAPTATIMDNPNWRPPAASLTPTVETKTTKSGTKYIYKIDGKQIRTSNRQYEGVAVAIKDGKMTAVLGLGNDKTTAKYVADGEARRAFGKAMLDVYSRKAPYSEYVKAYNRIYSDRRHLIRKYYEQALNDPKEYSQRIQWYKEIIKETEGATYRVIKFKHS